MKPLCRLALSSVALAPIPLVATLVSTASTASATEARIEAMGGGVKLWTVEDESNVFDFPSLLQRWGNVVYLDNLQGTAGDFPNGRFGFHYSLSDDTVLAIVGARADASTRGVGNGFIGAGNALTGSQALGVAFQASQAGDTGDGAAAGPAIVGGDAIGNVDFRYGLMFATTLGSKGRIGVSLNVLGDDADIDSPNNAQVDQGALLFDLGLGFGFDLEGSELELAAGVEVGFLEDSRDEPEAVSGVPGNLLEHWSGSHFGLRLQGRWTIDFFDQTKIVAYTQFLLGSQSVDRINTAAIPAESGSYSATSFTLGADLRIEPFQHVFISPGLGFFFAQQTLEGPVVVDRDADLLFGLPFYGVGVDLKLASWVDMRFGAQQFVTMLRESTTTGGITTTASTSDVATTFAWGLGFNIPVAESSLAIDLALNPTFLTNGPHVLTGNATGPFALNGALRYNW
jgi:hypothetical protein